MRGYNEQKARQQYQNSVNNAQGNQFEGMIKAACLTYSFQDRAEVDKVPEPFRVTQKHGNGQFTGRFTAAAQPDFSGTLAGGKSICFEAKYTTTDRLQRSILTEEQMESLERHTQLGAMTGICAGIGDQFFFVPWIIWKHMKQIFGRQYVKAADIEEYRVKFTGAVMFLDYIHPQGGNKQ